MKYRENISTPPNFLSAAPVFHSTKLLNPLQEVFTYVHRVDVSFVVREVLVFSLPN